MVAVGAYCFAPTLRDLSRHTIVEASCVLGPRSLHPICRLHALHVVSPASISNLSSPSDVPLPAVPLVVDVDGTLTPCDLFWEGIARLLTTRRRHLPAALGSLFRGRAAIKQAIARAAAIDLAGLPLSDAVLARIRRAQLDGQAVILASGADHAQVCALAARVAVADAWGSDGRANMTGLLKLERLRAEYGAFDYVGNEAVDRPLWTAARVAYSAQPTAAARRLLRRIRPDAIQLTSSSTPWRALVRALRPHQWTKNALILVPALMAHRPLTPFLLGTLLAGVLCFSGVASAIYLVNDVADLDADRAHAQKRRRPLASGTLPIPWALVAAPVLLVGGLGSALWLNREFALVLVAYAGLSLAYSFNLKRRLLVDILCLALLYSVRVVAGGVLTNVVLSRWLLPFALFLFIALAIIKRVTELGTMAPIVGLPLGGRAYRPEDRTPLLALGAGATMGANLVFCLYVTSPDTTALYQSPDWLWPVLPLLLYWQARVWIFAWRGSLHHDPITFALRDRISYLTLVATIICVVVARGG